MVQPHGHEVRTRLTATAHLPALDGLRGIAILLVMLYHSVLFTRMSTTTLADTIYYRIVNSAWLGVDLFFVLSGFLITRLLVETRANERFFTTFYARRALRIVPLYYAALVVVFWLRPFVAAAPGRTHIAVQDQLWYWGYAANLLIALKGWSPFSLGLLDHFWTLAVEEQFYLVWPLLVFVCRRRTLILICGAGIVTSLSLRVALVGTGHSVAAYVLPVARLDSLAVGALVALVARSPQREAWLTKLAVPVAGASSAGLLAIALWRGGFFKTDPVVLTIGLTLLAGLGGALVVLASSPRATPRLRTVCTAASLRLCGRYRYGLYVVHQPIFIWVYSHGFKPTAVPPVRGSAVPGQVAFLLLAGTLSLGLALLSWRVLEQPCLRLKARFPYEARAPRPPEPRRQLPDLQAEHVL